jgi:hypothetical protein
MESPFMHALSSCAAPFTVSAEQAFPPLFPFVPPWAGMFGALSPALPSAPFPAMRSQRVKLALAWSATTAIDEPPGVAASAACTVKSISSAPAVSVVIVNAGLSVSPSSTLFVVAPTYVHPLWQSSPP